MLCREILRNRFLQPPGTLQFTTQVSLIVRGYHGLNLEQAKPRRKNQSIYVQDKTEEQGNQISWKILFQCINIFAFVTAVLLHFMGNYASLSPLSFPVLLNYKWHTSKLLSLIQIEVKIFLEGHKSKSCTQTCNISSIILHNATIFFKYKFECSR